MTGESIYIADRPSAAAKRAAAHVELETAQAAMVASKFSEAAVDRYERARENADLEDYLMQEFIERLPSKRFMLFEVGADGQPTGRDMIVRVLDEDEAMNLRGVRFKNMIVHPIGEIETWIAAWQRLTYQTKTGWRFRS